MTGQPKKHKKGQTVADGGMNILIF